MGVPAKINESDFRLLYRLNWARKTSWGWWDEWDDTALQTQYSKFKPWRSEAEHATPRSGRLYTLLSLTSGWGKNIFVSFKPTRPGNEPRKAAVLTTALGPPPSEHQEVRIVTGGSWLSDLVDILVNRGTHMYNTHVALTECTSVLLNPSELKYIRKWL